MYPVHGPCVAALAAPGFHRADAHRQAAHGPPFILGLARPAVARRSCQTLDLRMPYFRVPLAIVRLCRILSRALHL